MQNQNKSYQKWKKLVTPGSLLFFYLWTLPVFAQVQSISTVQNLSFGAFTQGSNGGTVIISDQGERSATGSVVLFNLGQPYYPSLFDVVAPAGTIISITNGPDVTLTGSNGGRMRLQLGTSYPVAPFIADLSGTTRVSVGGTLTMGNAVESPPGSYTGTFYITFNNE